MRGTAMHHLSLGSAALDELEAWKAKSAINMDDTEQLALLLEGMYGVDVHPPSLLASARATYRLDEDLLAAIQHVFEIVSRLLL